MTQKDEKNEKAAVLPYARAQQGGFFTIYRPHQGKWTRLGTAVGSAIVIIGFALFIYNDIRATVGMTLRNGLLLAAAFVVVAAALAFWLQNRPRNASFLIETDSEMKKVSWTSREVLIGSTRIVILFMLLMSVLLFVIDILFAKFFSLIGVLKTGAL